MSLVGLAQRFVMPKEMRLKKKTPELTPDMALRLLRNVLQGPKPTDEEAVASADYHLERNRVVRRSYQKPGRNGTKVEVQTVAVELRSRNWAFADFWAIRPRDLPSFSGSAPSRVVRSHSRS
jgi:hypothetical protein